ncbi:MAG TPA: adenine phosphoribosyltransferase [Emticicia sp.]
MIEAKLRSVIRDIPDFPKPGIIFKDITPIFKDPQLCTDIIEAFVERLDGRPLDVIAGIESRGFFFGLLLANRLKLPFVPIRKKGKLPYKTVQQSYNLEYGAETIEMHEDAIEAGQHVLIHDDLLATGGTVEATSRLIEKQGGIISGYTFLISLGFLKGSEKVNKFSDNIISLAEF